MTKTTDKRKQLIETAFQLFYQHGIHAVGINEILAQSGVAKKTLYNHFASKEALIQACVTERDKAFMQWFTKRCITHHSATEFIEQIFSALHDWINENTAGLGDFNGCFFINAAAEYADSNNEINQLCMQHKQQVKHFFEHALTTQLSNKTQVTALVDLLFLLKEGCINSAHVLGDKQAALKAKTLAVSYLAQQSLQ